MNILVTNDDGVTSPGLFALVQSLRQIGNVHVLAPDRNWSLTGHVRTIDRPLRVRSVALADGSSAWACDGSPSDCAAMGACGFFEEKMDLVVSGINTSANLGQDVTYSGTVTAAMEAVISGLPAIAVSLDIPAGFIGTADYQPAASAALKVTEMLLKHGIRPDTLLNVNVPYLPLHEIRGIRATRLGMRVYHDQLDKRIDPRGKPYYWVMGETPGGIAETGSDIGALAAGYVSVTPVQMDMTAYLCIPEISHWDWDAQSQPVYLPESSIYLPG
jgi:5'-nucleotidase